VSKLSYFKSWIEPQFEFLRGRNPSEFCCFEFKTYWSITTLADPITLRHFRTILSHQHQCREAISSSQIKLKLIRKPKNRFVTLSALDYVQAFHVPVHRLHLVPATRKYFTSRSHALILYSNSSSALGLPGPMTTPPPPPEPLLIHVSTQSQYPP
jgi:hypothetical protein